MRKISVPIISVDPFLGDKEIKWDKICEIESVAYPMQATSFNFNNQLQIYLSLEYRGGNSYLVLYYDKKRIKASKGDELLLLLDNSKSINLFFDSRSQAVVNDTIIPIVSEKEERIMDRNYILYEFDNGNFNQIMKSNIRCMSFSLEQSQLKLLWKQKVTNWRIILNNEGGTCIDGKNENSWYNYDISCNFFHEYVDEFIKTLIGNNCKIDVESLLVNEKNVEFTSANVAFEWCSVYLMEDKSNGYYKIGVSNNPHYREYSAK
ncbi:hypothetical protein [Prevotella sp.]|uniref:hypothetical protein n=1 Tax=Prevotella sp. TaxID=59823 RepID=UPI002F93A2CA